MVENQPSIYHIIGKYLAIQTTSGNTALPYHLKILRYYAKGEIKYEKENLK